MKKIIIFVIVALTALPTPIKACYNENTALYEPLFWGVYAPVKRKNTWRGYDTSNWGAPFNTETKPWIVGVYTGK